MHGFAKKVVLVLACVVLGARGEVEPHPLKTSAGIAKEWAELTAMKARVQLGFMKHPKPCFPEIGCFDTGPPFYDPVYRWVSVAPEPCDDLVHILYTPHNPSVPLNLTKDTREWQKSPFNGRLPTKWLIGGFTQDNGNIRRAASVKDAFLHIGKFNVIITDMRKYMEFPFYKAIANARTIGARIAVLIDYLTKHRGASSKDFHLMGYSLGCHIAGYVGKRVPNLGRITALDPSGPFFPKSDEVRLNHRDALFVDALHLDGADSGSLLTFGHMDFYPNGGAFQPGCTPEFKAPIYGKALTDVERFIGFICHHNKSIAYFNESITSTGCRFEAVSCDSWENFQEGRCVPGRNGSVMSEMGLRARPVRGVPPGTKFYLRTAGAPPYCLLDGYKPGLPVEEKKLVSKEPTSSTVHAH